MLPGEERIGSIATQEAVIEFASRAGRAATLVVQTDGHAKPREHQWQRLIDGRWMLVAISYPGEAI